MFYLPLELLVLARSGFVPVLGRVSSSGVGTYWIWLVSALCSWEIACDSSPTSLDFILRLLVLTTCLKLTFLEALDLLNWDPCCISATTGWAVLFQHHRLVGAQQTQPGFCAGVLCFLRIKWAFLAEGRGHCSFGCLSGSCLRFKIFFLPSGDGMTWAAWAWRASARGKVHLEHLVRVVMSLSFCFVWLVLKELLTGDET